MCVWVVNEPDLSVRFIGQPCKLPASSTLSELQEAILTARWFQLCWKHYALSQLCHLELVSTILTLGMSFKCCYHMITWPCSAYTHTHTHTQTHSSINYTLCMYYVCMYVDAVDWACECRHSKLQWCYTTSHDQRSQHHSGIVDSMFNIVSCICAYTTPLIRMASLHTYMQTQRYIHVHSSTHLPVTPDGGLVLAKTRPAQWVTLYNS